MGIAIYDKYVLQHRLDFFLTLSNTSPALVDPQWPIGLETLK